MFSRRDTRYQVWVHVVTAHKVPQSVGFALMIAVERPLECLAQVIGEPLVGFTDVGGQTNGVPDLHNRTLEVATG